MEKLPKLIAYNSFLYGDFSNLWYSTKEAPKSTFFFFFFHGLKAVGTTVFNENQSSYPRD